MLDTTRLTEAERDVLVEALMVRIEYFEAYLRGGLSDTHKPAIEWRLWQARELLDALR